MPKTTPELLYTDDNQLIFASQSSQSLEAPQTGSLTPSVVGGYIEDYPHLAYFNGVYNDIYAALFYIQSNSILSYNPITIYQPGTHVAQVYYNSDNAISDVALYVYNGDVEAKGSTTNFPINEPLSNQGNWYRVNVNPINGNGVVLRNNGIISTSDTVPVNQVPTSGANSAVLLNNEGRMSLADSPTPISIVGSCDLSITRYRRPTGRSRTTRVYYTSSPTTPIVPVSQTGNVPPDSSWSTTLGGNWALTVDYNTGANTTYYGTPQVLRSTTATMHFHAQGTLVKDAFQIFFEGVNSEVLSEAIEPLVNVTSVADTLVIDLLPLNFPDRDKYYFHGLSQEDTTTSTFRLVRSYIQPVVGGLSGQRFEFYSSRDISSGTSPYNFPKLLMYYYA